MLTNYVSIKQTIGRFLKNLGLADTSYVDDIPQWTEDAIQIMEISNYYTYKYKMIKVEEYKAILPCDHEHLYGFWVSNSCNIESNRNNLRRLFIRNSPLFGKGLETDNTNRNIGNSFYGVPNESNDLFKPIKGRIDSNIYNQYNTAQYASINGGVIHTSFRQGYIYCVYTGVPLDCDGYPLVPKDAKVHEALQYWYIYQMSFSGFVHPVVSRQEAYQMWNRLYPAAANSVNWMDLQEYQEFTELWTNVLMGDLNANNYIN